MTTNPIIAAELAVVVNPLQTFLSALQAPGANTETVVQDYAALQLAEIQNAPLIESVGIAGIAKAAQAKLNEALATASTVSSSASGTAA
jgi:hypothetical protein